MSKFSESVAALKKKQFREWAAQHGEWPDADIQTQFDGAIQGLKDKRHQAYADAIMKKYPKDFVAKVFEWSRVELSPLEMDRIKTFEGLSTAFIEANPDNVTADELGLFFDKKTGKAQQIPDVEDRPLGELEFDKYGNLTEKAPAPRMKVSPRVPEINEARRMTSDELAAILPKGD
jgi:hypothetical protein